MEQKWHYAKDGKKHGPVSESALSDLLSVEEISPDTLVWHEGLGEWRELSSCRELSQSLGIALTPPPIPNRDLKDHIWNEPIKPTESSIPQPNNDGRPNSIKFISASFVAGVVCTLVQGEFDNFFGGIGYALGLSLSLVLFTYIISAVPLIVYYIIKKRRAPFEAALVWTVLIIITLLVVIGSTIFE